MSALLDSPRDVSRWKASGALCCYSASASEQAKVVYRAKKDPISGECSIYWTDAVSSKFGEIPALLEECENLEVAAVWDAHHVEDRLRDHFDGRPNEWVESMRLSRWLPGNPTPSNHPPC